MQSRVRRKWLAALVVGGLAASVGGCGGDGKTAPVSGVVTLNGKPTADIAVTFEPIAEGTNNNPGMSATGVTDSNGQYALKVLGDERRGATVGKNRVRFSPHTVPTDFSDEGLAKMKAPVQIPGRYWSDSKIEFLVPASGTSSADFQLTTP